MMQNFRRCGFFMLPAMLTELEANDYRWGEIKDRQNAAGTCSADTESIFLRWSPVRTVEAMLDDVNTIDYQAVETMPLTMRLLREVGDMVRPNAGMGRAIFTRLKPRGQVLQHIDHGRYSDCHDRYHLSLLSSQGNYFYSEVAPGQVERVYMAPGEVWWFDKTKPHWVVNETDAPRVHLIVDFAK